MKEGQRGGPDSGVNYAFYPVISEGHPYSQAIDRFAAAGYESADEVPDERRLLTESFPALDLDLAGLRAAGTALGKRTDREWLTALFYSPAALSAELIA